MADSGSKSKIHLTISKGVGRRSLHPEGTHAREKPLAFKADSKDYSIPEFYSTFQHCLPLIVIVTQGYFGDIFSCSFNRRQILFISTVSKQRRILANYKSPTGPRLLSIPDTYTEKFCVVENTKGASGQERNHSAVKEEYLYTLLNGRNMPFWVELPKDRSIVAGSRRIKTNNFQPFQVTQTFEEVSLLGNFIYNGYLSGSDTSPNVSASMDFDVLQIPVFLSKLRISVVNGIENQPVDVWVAFKEEVKRISGQIEYDMQTGNINIAEYSRSDLNPTRSFTYIQPVSYISITHLLLSPSFQDPKTTPDADSDQSKVTADSGDGVYDSLDETAIRKSFPGKNITSKTDNQSSHNAGVRGCVQYERLENPAGGPPLPTRIIAEASLSKITSELLSKFEIMNTELRKPDLGGSGLSKTTYTNSIPRTTIPPTNFRPQISENVSDKPKENNHKDQIKVETPGSLTQANTTENVVPSAGLTPDVTSTEDVAKLTIRGVGEYLKILNLKDYVQMFEDEQIDGTLLVELDRDVLQSDFGMTAVEAIRLRKFAKDGHIPL